ncbi:MAG: Imm52 family immunity protein [Stellaceae bacterium]|jgi:hypothetical protein
MTAGASYTLYAFWKARPESTEACAERLARMFQDLAAIHPAFARWCKKAMTLAPPDKPFCSMPPQIKELTAIFDKGRYFKDVPREPIPQLGYMVYAWNGIRGPQGLSFSVHAGAYTERKRDPNMVDFGFQGIEPGNESLLNAKILKQVLLAVVSAWEADWGVIESWGYEGQLKNADGQLFRPWGGWITYLSPAYAQKISPPRTATVEQTPGGGLLMLATEEPFTATNPAHVAAVDAIQACLKPIQVSPPLRKIPRPAI